MKKQQIIEMYEYLDKVKISTIKDKAVKMTLMQDLLILWQAAKDILAENRNTAEYMLSRDRDRKEEKDQMLRRMQGLSKEEQEATLRRILDEYSDILDLEELVAKTLLEQMQDEANIELRPIDSLALTDAFEEAGIPYSGADITLLSPMLSFDTLNSLCDGSR